MPKIKSRDDFDEELLDDFVNKKSKKKKKKSKKKKKKYKKEKNNKKKSSSKSKKKKHKKKKKKGYIDSIDKTSKILYENRYNKSFVNSLLDIFKVNVDVKSKVNVNLRDETIAALISIGAATLRGLITKKITK